MIEETLFRENYIQVVPKIGHPLCAETLVGPLIDKWSVKDFLNAQEAVVKEGGKM